MSVLSQSDRIALVNVISRLSDFAEPRGRGLLLRLANLGRFSGTIDLSGAARATAADLVLRLEDFGPLPDQPGAHALGRTSDLPP